MDQPEIILTLLQLLDMAFSKLTPLERFILLMHHGSVTCEGWSKEKIASHKGLGLSSSEVQNIIDGCHEKMRKVFKDHLGEEGFREFFIEVFECFERERSDLPYAIHRLPKEETGFSSLINQEEMEGIDEKSDLPGESKLEKDPPQ